MTPSDRCAAVSRLEDGPHWCRAWSGECYGPTDEEWQPRSCVRCRRRRVAGSARFTDASPEQSLAEVHQASAGWWTGGGTDDDNVVKRWEEVLAFDEGCSV